VTVHAENWQIKSCPVNGPAIAARGREVVVAWFSGKDAAGQAFVSFSHDAGRSFAAPIRVDEGGTLGRVGVVLRADGSAVVSWIDYVARRAEFRLRIVRPAGERSPAATVAPLTSDRSTGFPRLIDDRGTLVLAWTESTRAADNAVRLRVLTAVVKPMSVVPAPR